MMSSCLWRCPSGTGEVGVEFAVVLKKYPGTLWDGKDDVAMGSTHAQLLFLNIPPYPKH